MDNILDVLGGLRFKFGNYLDPGLVIEWKKQQETHPIGSIVIGKIELIYEFGCFLNIGAAFPALLLIPDIASPIRLSPQEYERAMTKGQEMKVTIKKYDEDKRQIVVTQKPE